MQLDPRFTFVPVVKVTSIEAGKAADLLPKGGYLGVAESEMITGHPISFRQSEQLRNNYTEAMMREYGFGRETAEQLRSDEIDAMVYGVDWGDPAGSWSVELTKLSEDMAQFENSPAWKEAVAAAKLTVAELQQTVVNGMKAARADGKLTKGDIKDLNERLIAQTKEKMSKPAYDILVAAAVDVEALILGTGEAWIEKIKRNPLGEMIAEGVAVDEE